MRGLEIPELRIVLICSGVLAFVGLSIAIAIIWQRNITSLTLNRSIGAAGFLLGGGLGWLIGMGIVLFRRR
jgi:hypothetical protein